MPSKFHERFQIKISNDVARARFVNRVHNEIYQEISYRGVHNSFHDRIARIVATHLGDRHQNSYLVNFVGDNFERNLEALEGLYLAFTEISNSLPMKLSEVIENVLQNSESDLGIKWEKGNFYPSGAALLDERLVNDSLHWLREKKFGNVLQPFEKGLRHLLDARKRPELAEDVITDVYEALEALAGIVTGRPNNDLSANQELFASEVKASDGYKKLLKEYINYANTFRHAKRQDKPRPKISLEEAESFLYLTGIFVRFAVVAKG